MLFKERLVGEASGSAGVDKSLTFDEVIGDMGYLDRAREC